VGVPEEPWENPVVVVIGIMAKLKRSITPTINNIDRLEMVLRKS